MKLSGKILLIASAALGLVFGSAACTQAASYPTVYNGVDYSKIYNYNYYVKKYADVKKKYGTDKKAVLKNFAEHGLHHGRLGNSYCTTAAGKRLCRRIMYKTIMSASDAAVSKMLYRSATSKKTKQIILVIGKKLTFWEKGGYGIWEKKLSAGCYIGRNGFSADRKEGDGTTPVGSFKIVYAFGNAANPGTKMKYRRTTENSWLSSEKATYNQWVETSGTINGERLRSISLYKYAMWIGYNVNPTVYNKGSAIFLHCKGSRTSTAGCVAVSETMMKKILKKAKNGTYMVIVPKRADILNY